MKLLWKTLAGMLLGALTMVFLPYMAAAANDGYPSIANGGNHYLAIKTDGTLWAWGDNRRGQLGDGTIVDKTEPIQVLEDASAVVAGFRHSLAIKTDGSLWAWGDNQHGQLGNGTTTESSMPIQVLDNVSVVAAGPNHSFAIKTDGSLWAWGFNTNGQLGDETSRKKTAPVKILDEVAFIASGVYHTLAIKTDGTLWAWGDNKYGQIGDGTTAKKSSPVQVLDDVAFAVAGGDHTFAIKTDGSLWAWGDNTHGQVGDGTDNASLIPVKILNDVAFTAPNGLAIKTDGSLWAWGFNHFAQQDGKSSYKPEKVMDDVVSVSFATAVKGDGSLWFWREKSSTLLFAQPNRPLVGNAAFEKKLSNVVAIAADDNSVDDYCNNLALKQDGTLYFYGYTVSDYRQDIPDWADDNIVFHSRGTKYTVTAFGPTKVLESVQPPQPYQLYIPAPAAEPVSEPAQQGQLPSTGLESASSWAMANLQKAADAQLVPISLRGDYTQPITRAEFCALIVAYIEADGNTSVEDFLLQRGLAVTENFFDDTNDINVAYAYALNIVGGMGEGRFNPDGDITREQAAAMLIRLRAVLGADTVGSPSARFSDSERISTWAADAVNYVYAQAIMGGVGNNTFDPQGKFTREQAIVTFLRIYDNY